MSDCPPLPDGMALHVCLTCGAVVAAKGTEFHEQWHQNAAGAAIEAQRRLDRIEASGREELLP